MTIRLIIAGGRDFNDFDLMIDSLGTFLPDVDLTQLVLLCGEARGADIMGKNIMLQFPDVTIESYPADWNTYPRAAGMIRNTQMAENATHLLAFWDGKSSGTRHMITTAQRMNLITQIIKY